MDEDEHLNYEYDGADMNQLPENPDHLNPEDEGADPEGEGEILDAEEGEEQYDEHGHPILGVEPEVVIPIINAEANSDVSDGDLDITPRQSAPNLTVAAAPPVPKGRGQKFALRPEVRQGLTAESRKEITLLYKRNERIYELPKIDGVIMHTFFKDWPSKPKYPTEAKKAAFHNRYPGLLREWDLCKQHKDIQELLRQAIQIMDSVKGVPPPAGESINKAAMDSIQLGADKLVRIGNERRRNLFHAHQRLKPQVHLLLRAELFDTTEMQTTLYGLKFTDMFMDVVQKAEEFNTGLEAAARRENTNPSTQRGNGRGYRGGRGGGRNPGRGQRFQPRGGARRGGNAHTRGPGSGYGPQPKRQRR